MICPAGPPLFAYAAGSLIGWYCPEWRDMFLLGLLISVPLALWAFLGCRRSALGILPLLLCLVLLAALRTGARLRPEFPKDHVLHRATGKPLLLEAVLVREPEVRNAFTRLIVEARAVRASEGTVRAQGRVDLWVSGRVPELRVGDILAAEVRLKIPRNYGNPGEIDRRARSFLQGLCVKGSIRGAHHLFRLGVAEGYRLERCLQAARCRLAAFFAREEDPRVRGLLRAWFLGDRSGLSERLTEVFRSSGLAHILAISGLHVGLVGFFAYRGLRALLKGSVWMLLRFSTEKIAVLGCLPVVGAYVLLAGSPTTAVRAATMLALFAGARLLDRVAAVWNSLALAGLLILLWDPAALFSVSFQLSFTAVAGLLAVGSSWGPLPRERPLQGPGVFAWLPRLAGAWVWRLFSATFAAGMATAPIAAFYFNRVTPLAVFANLIVVPLVGWIVIPFGIVTSGIALIWPGVATPLLRVTSVCTQWVVAAAEVFSEIPFACLRVGRPSVIEIALFYLAFFVWFGAKPSPWRKRVLWTAVALFCLSLASSTLRSRSDSGLAVTFLAVGQGDGILVEFPGGKRMIVDGGLARAGYHDAGRSIVSPFLGHRRIRRLDYMVASHGQADHYGGLPFLADHFEPEELWIGPELGCEPEGYFAFLDQCRRDGIRIRRLCRSREPFSIQGVGVDVLNPFCPGEGEREGERWGASVKGSLLNDSSLVLRLTLGRVSILLTGDIEQNAERGLVAYPESLRSALLKVPHHGSSSSSRPAFLDSVAPAVAVVSSGYGNRFNFPSERVVRSCRERGIVLYRTDLDGAVRIRTDGRSLWVETFGKEGRR